MKKKSVMVVCGYRLEKKQKLHLEKNAAKKHGTPSAEVRALIDKDIAGRTNGKSLAS